MIFFFFTISLSILSAPFSLSSASVMHMLVCFILFHKSVRLMLFNSFSFLFLGLYNLNWLIFNYANTILLLSIFFEFLVSVIVLSQVQDFHVALVLFWKDYFYLLIDILIWWYFCYILTWYSLGFEEFLIANLKLESIKCMSGFP